MQIISRTLMNMIQPDYKKWTSDRRRSLDSDLIYQYSRSRIYLECVTCQSYYRGFSLVPTTVVVPPENVMAVEGSTVVLVCTAEGNPTPHVAWIAPNGTVLQNRTTDTNLTLPNVSRHSSGTYQCNATNELGSDSATVNLDVWCKCFCSFLGFRRNGLQISFNPFSKVDHPHRPLLRFTCLFLLFVADFYFSVD